MLDHKSSLVQCALSSALAKKHSQQFASRTVAMPKVELHVHREGATSAETIFDLEDEALVAQPRDRRIPLEVCPQSNYCLGVVGRGQAHPIRQMVDPGLYCTLNSDDPPM